MSGFVFKLIAIIAMLIDHTGHYLQITGSQALSFETINYMRAIGRIALPIFVYFIVVGYRHTTNAQRYIGRMHLFALLSQIPFTLAFYIGNIYPQSYRNFVDYNINSIIFLIPMLILYYIYISKYKMNLSFIYVALAWIIVPIMWYFNNYYLLIGDELNIFYELGIGLISFKIIDEMRLRLRTNKLNFRNIIDIILLFILLALGVIYIGSRANYEYNAIYLMFILFAFRQNKYIESLAIGAWGYYMYGYDLLFFIPVLIIAILLLFYNGKKGKGLKYLFYAFYPLHLIIFSILQVLKIK